MEQPKPRGRPPKPRTDGFGPRDFGLTTSQWSELHSDRLASDWYRREICERQRHTHGEKGELECVLLNLAEATRTHDPKAPRPALDWYRREICAAEGHTHGEAGELDCLLMRLADLRTREKRAVGA